jgi:archaellum component FlaC
MTKNNIILKATGELEDIEARKTINQLDSRVQTINDRTKNHTFQLERIDKKVIQIDNDMNKIKRELEELNKLK